MLATFCLYCAGTMLVCEVIASVIIVSLTIVSLVPISANRWLSSYNPMDLFYINGNILKPME